MTLSWATTRADGVGTDMTETERRVAWLRLAAVPLLAVGESLPHPNAATTAFYIALGIFGGFAAGVLWHVYHSRVGRGFALAVTVADVVSITTLALLSGGAYSPARLAFFLVPIAVAFRFRSPLTAIASATTLVAFLVQALLHPSAERPDAYRFIAVSAGYLAWIGLAAVLFSAVLERRTHRVNRAGRGASAAHGGRADGGGARAAGARRGAPRPRHPEPAIGPARARGGCRSGAASRRSRAPTRRSRRPSRIFARRSFELHPFVLDEAGLPPRCAPSPSEPLGAVGFRVTCDLQTGAACSHDRLLLSAARQLLANVAQHAAASNVRVTPGRSGTDSVVLTVEDDGVGFDPATLPGRVAAGHIGLASQQERVQSVGGRLEIHSAPGHGTRVEVDDPRVALLARCHGRGSGRRAQAREQLLDRENGAHLGLDPVELEQRRR